MGDTNNYNKVDRDGNVTGGHVEGIGLEIMWQDGPVVDGVRNGAFVDDVLAAALQRLEAYEESRLSCFENQHAITKIQEAMQWLDSCRRGRESRGVQGTYEH